MSLLTYIFTDLCQFEFFGLDYVLRWLEVEKDWKTCILQLLRLILTFQAHFKHIWITIWGLLEKNEKLNKKHSSFI